MNLLEYIKLYYGNGYDNLTLLRDWIGQVYEITKGEKRYIAKVFRKEYTKQALQPVAVMQYLRKNSFPVPDIIKTLAGNSSIEYNNQTVVLYEFIDGQDMEKASNLITIGRQTGWMRKLMESYSGEVATHGYDFFINRYLDIMKKKGYRVMINLLN